MGNQEDEMQLLQGMSRRPKNTWKMYL